MRAAEEFLTPNLEKTDETSTNLYLVKCSARIF